jgi:hypothetical protein
MNHKIPESDIKKAFDNGIRVETQISCSFGEKEHKELIMISEVNFVEMYEGENLEQISEIYFLVKNHKKIVLKTSQLYHAILRYNSI